MRRTLILFALMISLLCFSGCGNTAEYEDKFEAFRESLSLSEEILMTAKLTVNLDDTTEVYELSCSASGAEAVVDIMSPSEIAGVRARITGEDLELEYDGVILDSGELTESGVTPLSALPCLIGAMKTGYLKLCWVEKDGDTAFFVAKLYISDTACCLIWFDPTDMRPTAAEIYEGENMVVQCEISAWAS